MLAAELLCAMVLAGCGAPSGEDGSGNDLFGETNREGSGEFSEEGPDFADPNAGGQDTKDIAPETQNTNFENFDFQNGTYVASAAVDTMFKNSKTAIYGIHQDTLYLVELLENGSRIIRIKTDGTVESSEAAPQSGT